MSPLGLLRMGRSAPSGRIVRNSEGGTTAAQLPPETYGPHWWLARSQTKSVEPRKWVFRDPRDGAALVPRPCM
ncbi:hypothetical protein GCM10010365_46300 [Streptomyces poonensis]|uniref:Uncharacterized protein n=1 Tax=Streptomyces poonensis TaxID=68255 RepID=A0A918PSQ2_9ACTN|nr:hypothetical protein GCM10010365_46300 [Streptomyces poonensis]